MRINFEPVPDDFDRQAFHDRIVQAIAQAYMLPVNSGQARYDYQLTVISKITGVDYSVVDASCRYLAKRDGIPLLQAAEVMLKELQ